MRRDMIETTDGHDYVMVSCFGSASGPPGSVDVRARCQRCGHMVEIKGAQMTGIDYGPPTEGIGTIEMEMVPVDDARGTGRER